MALSGTSLRNDARLFVSEASNVRTGTNHKFNFGFVPFRSATVGVHPRTRQARCLVTELELDDEVLTLEVVYELGGKVGD